MLVAAVVGIFLSISPVFADNNAVDSLQAAQVWGGIKIASYEGQFGFDRGQQAGGWASFRFKMQGEKIVYLAKEENGVILVGENDTPLNGLPSNSVGETRSFSLWLSALDDQGQVVACGDFSKNLLLPGEPIVVILRPSNWVMKVILFSGEDAVNAVLKTDSGGTFDYNAQANGFIVFVDPLKSVTSYMIISTISGLTLSSGVINPMAPVPKQDGNSVVNIALVGGVVTVPDGDNVYLNSQKINGQVNNTPAKVYIWNLGGRAGNVNAWSNTGAMHISILRWVSMGDMPEVVSGDLGYVSVGDGYGKVIVVITGATDNFSVNFSTGNNGGKG